MKLTKRNIERLRKKAAAEVAMLRSREAILWDDDLPGLGLRVGSSGAASWLVYKRLGQGGKRAKQIRTVFAAYGELPDPEKAREKARSIIEAIRSGINPNADKRNQRTTDIDAFRNGKLEPLLNEWQTKQPKDGYYGSEVSRMVKVDIVPTLGASTLVRDVTRKHALFLLDKKSPSVARSLFAILRPFFKWCVEREIIGKSPIEGLAAPKPGEARDRVLTDRELVLVWNAASALPYPWGPFYKLLILTAQRRDEVANLSWSELDLKKREWLIPSSRTKNGKEHLVHLSGWAASTLHSIADQSGDVLVFTTSHKDGIEVPVSGFSKAKLLLDSKIKQLNQGKAIPEWRIHDLRRTAATGMGSLGVPPHIVERILNHISGVNGGLVGVYQRFEHVEERRDALKAWANHINELALADMAKERDAANVVRLRN